MIYKRLKRAYRWLRYTKTSTKKRDARFLLQRVTRGWGDDDTFSLDYSLAKLIAPRLRRFKEITIGNDYSKLSTERKEWAEELDKMISAFEWYGSENRWNDNEFEMMKKHQEGLDLFAKYYGGLWW